ncbi:hypothetical protein HYH03_002111 [Edaphochlamys debaryana]|uniref:Uncharacterized protein n=1 Tax=Edaphochlamys debaryana TaxID=47281 RepID=A0A835YLE2_9CHLO|nr:hypothetical protein HYH03_002111 [Edaphochlamys debaryana]|eukprot:KAG2499819.1 hypothetical protein HYH03_002111 [Edaphochlamys debaryana]
MPVNPASSACRTRLEALTIDASQCSDGDELAEYLELPLAGSTVAERKRIKSLTIVADEDDGVSARAVALLVRSLPSLQSLSLRCSEPSGMHPASAAQLVSAVEDLLSLQQLTMSVGLKPGPVFTGLASRLTQLSIRLSPGSGGPPFGDDASLQPLSRLTALRELTVYGTEADMARASSAALVIDRARLGRILGGRLPPHLTRLALRLCAILRPPPPPGGGRATPAARHSLAFSFAAGKLTAVELPPAPAPGPAADPAALPELELAELGTLCKVLMDSRAMGPRLPRLFLGCVLNAAEISPFNHPWSDHMEAADAFLGRCDSTHLQALDFDCGAWKVHELVSLLGTWPLQLRLSPSLALRLGPQPDTPGPACSALAAATHLPSPIDPLDLPGLALRRLAAACAAFNWERKLEIHRETRHLFPPEVLERMPGPYVVLMLRGPGLEEVCRDPDEELQSWVRDLMFEVEGSCFESYTALPRAGAVLLSCRADVLRRVREVARTQPYSVAAGVVATVVGVGGDRWWPNRVGAAPSIKALLEEAVAQVLQAVWDGVEEGSGLRWGRAERLAWICSAWEGTHVLWDEKSAEGIVDLLGTLDEWCMQSAA